MASAPDQRIQASCQTIWGNGDYDIDIENEHCIIYWAHVKRDLGTSFRPPLTMARIFDSADDALREMDRMLFAWASHIRGREPKTEHQSLEVSRGPNGQNKAI